MRISLITTVKNEAGSADALIQAIRHQTRRPDEWVVVDGGSTDGTVEKFRREPSCKVLELNCNIADGRNQALAASSGDIVAITDAGCRPTPSWLERLVAPLQRGEADISTGETLPLIRSSFDIAQWVLLDQFAGPIPLRRERALSSRCLAFHRKICSEAPFPVWLDHGEDTWLISQWRRDGRKIVWVDAVVEWEMRPTWRNFLLQHFRYMRGDGRALMHTGRHLLRFAFYLGLIAMVCFSHGHGMMIVMVIALWIVYFGLTAIGSFRPEIRQRTVTERLGAAALLLPLLLIMDASKSLGYLRGLLDRIGRRSRRQTFPGSP